MRVLPSHTITFSSEADPVAHDRCRGQWRGEAFLCGRWRGLATGIYRHCPKSSDAVDQLTYKFVWPLQKTLTGQAMQDSKIARITNRLTVPQLRRGATVVEFSLVLPILFTILFGMIEFTRLSNIRHAADNAAYQAARAVVVPGASSADAGCAGQRLASQSRVYERDDRRYPVRNCRSDRKRNCPWWTYRWLPTLGYPNR